LLGFTISLPGARLVLAVTTLVVATLGLTIQPAAATSFVMISDRALAEQAPVIAEVSVLASSAAPVSGTPSTDYLVFVERLIKGSMSGSAVVVRVVGGIRPDGYGLRIDGAPSFKEGEQAVLFLTPRADGTYAILHLMLGAFHRVEIDGRDLAIRDLSGASAMGGDVDSNQVDLPREVSGFTEWLSDLVVGVERNADYFVTDPGHTEWLPYRAVRHRIARAESPGDEPMRWRWNPKGYDGKGAGRRAITEAMRSWDGVGEPELSFRLRGTSRSKSGLEERDGRNTVLFNDPNDWLPGRFSCATGGILAVSGPWFDSRQTFESSEKGRRKHRIVEADILTNDGSQCFFSGKGRTRAARVLAHELGHSVGFGHSSDPDSLMFALPTAVAANPD